MISLRKLFGLIIIVVLLFPQHSKSQPIYKRNDPSGKPVYSSTPSNSKDQPATLPSIEKENLGEKIARLKLQTPPSCFSHGGVDCAQGTDQDGSVICLDGFRDSLLLFHSNCTLSRLTTSGVVLLNKEGKPLERKESAKAKTLQLSLRNSTGVRAEGVKVVFVLPDFRKITTFGPSEVEPYGIAEYIFHLDELSGRTAPRLSDRVQYKVTCENCSAVTKQ